MPNRFLSIRSLVVVLGAALFSTFGSAGCAADADDDAEEDTTVASTEQSSTKAPSCIYIARVWSDSGHRYVRIHNTCAFAKTVRVDLVLDGDSPCFWVGSADRKTFQIPNDQFFGPPGSVRGLVKC